MVENFLESVSQDSEWVAEQVVIPDFVFELKFGLCFPTASDRVEQNKKPIRFFVALSSIAFCTFLWFYIVNQCGDGKKGPNIQTTCKLHCTFEMFVFCFLIF
jgi:hypothetical protein